MRAVRSLKVMALSLVALAVLVVAEVSQAVAEGFLVADESHMTDLVNAHRAEHGMPALTQDAALQMVARRQASRMAAAGSIYHNPNLAGEASAAVPQWLKLGENVGVGGDVVQVADAFLASPPHHANIHNDSFRLIGLGAVPGAGALYFTQNFAQTQTPSSGQGSTPTATANASAAAQNGVVSTCRRRGRRTVCPRPRRSARRARVRGIEILRGEPGTSGVTFVDTVSGMFGRVGDKAIFWN